MTWFRIAEKAGFGKVEPDQKSFAIAHRAAFAGDDAAGSFWRGFSPEGSGFERRERGLGRKVCAWIGGASAPEGSGFERRERGLQGHVCT